MGWWHTSWLPSVTESQMESFGPNSGRFDIGLLQFYIVNLSIGEPFGYFNGLSAALIMDQMPVTPTIAREEEPQLPVTRLTPQGFQHRVRFYAFQPLLFGHGITLETAARAPIPLLRSSA